MSPAAPPLLSGPRLTTLFASILVSLASGTNYVFSAYGPQLAKRLSISHTKLNLIGISGNVGVYASAPLWGKLVDARGPKPGFVCAFVLLLAGYMGIKILYDAGIVADGPVFFALILCGTATGAGGNAGNSSGVNAVARSFPDRARATATGLVLSGFGLSAFLFSTISHVLFAGIPAPGNTSHFLTLLALGTALPQLVGLAFVRAVPHEEDGGHGGYDEDAVPAGYDEVPAGYDEVHGGYDEVPARDGVPGTRVGGEGEVLFDASAGGGLGAPRYCATNTSRTPLLAAEEGRAAPTIGRAAPTIAQKSGDLILHSESDDEDADVGFAPKSQHGVQPSMTPAIAYIPDAAEGVELSASPRSRSFSPARLERRLSESVDRRMSPALGGRGVSPSLDRGSLERRLAPDLERRISHDVEVNASRGSLEYRPRLNASRSRGVDAGRSLSRSARLLHEAEHAHVHRDGGRRPDHSPDALDESEEDEQDALLAPEVLIHPSHAHHHHDHPHAHGYEPANVHGRALFTSLDFWLLFVIVSTLSGTGLMYINNVGSMAQALYAGSLAEARAEASHSSISSEALLQPPAYDDAAAAALQATQVSILSVMNCAGRIVIGLASDFVKTRLGRVRSVLLVGVALSLFVSQVLAGNIDDPSSLWMATALLGFSYGSLFGVMPAVIIEWFGMVHFSENWGFISLAPMFAGNLFSLAFGRNLDREGERGAREAPAPVAAPDCVAGRSCYAATLHLTASCCFCALLLSVYAVWRDERKRGAWRRVTLSAAIFVALASGTNYVFSGVARERQRFYGPQLARRLEMSQTQLNLIGMSGSVGIYASAPIWGRLVDKQGPKRGFVRAFVLLLIGYTGIKLLYDTAVCADARVITALVLCGIATGAGGNAGSTSSTNAVAKSFPDRARATATSLVSAGFGLSAFLFSTISRTVFAKIPSPGNTSHFLTLLILGTALPQLVGLWLVAPIPHGEEYRSSRVEQGSDGSVDESRDTSDEREAGEQDALLAQPEVILPQHTDHRHTHHSDEHTHPAVHHQNQSYERVNSHRIELFSSLDFWLLFVIISTLSGTGLMYINNVGSMVRALYAGSLGRSALAPPDYDDSVASALQATQVSILSVSNCAGRISAGFASDFVKTRLGRVRSTLFVVIALGFFVSQVLTASTDSPESLWMATAVLGFSYGSLFGTMPAMVIDRFGLEHFSENYGFLQLSPLVGGNIFSFAFGRNLDREGEKQASRPSLLLRTSAQRLRDMER
ncbi:MFS general substrate transporter [Schizophyllum commune H4-8]|uniref:Nodulin-like domain-containing protein n=1 Tax=Schizophyllum commune (strain H4-8 / FGSC 9210) TaxID=578458 RepID=D8QEY3_SCHCM|nr:MFS general substrate transporter [Schizophyllum commune H4-8]KAI5887407.1 MFS general substrate transporter [Schizophyllum commune H4-8]